MQQEDEDHIAVLKTVNPTMSLKSVKDNILQYSNTLQNMFAYSVKKDLHMTIKRVTFCHGNRFTLPFTIHPMIFTISEQGGPICTQIYG